MTKKQKEEQRAAELRKQALLASGVQIEGLQQPSGDQAPRKVVYGNRKKKAPVDLSESKPSTREQSPVPEEQTAQHIAVKLSHGEADTKTDVKDDWEASSDEESVAQQPKDIKESWDDESAEESDSPQPGQPSYLL